MRRASILGLVAISLANSLIAQNSAPPQQVVPIPGPQAYSSPTPIDAIVTDSQGNLQEQSYTYYPNYYPQDDAHPNPNVVIVNNTQQVTSNGCAATCPSIFFPLFSLGFLYTAGYWCGYNGLYWNGFGYVKAGYARYLGSHRRNYLNRTWNNRGHNHWNSHQRDGNWRYRGNSHWADHSGRNWRQSGGQRQGSATQGGARSGGAGRGVRSGAGGRASGGRAGGGHGGAGHGGGGGHRR